MDREWNEESAEVSAPTVDEAVIIALMRLGVQREEAVIEVLDEGRRGLLGIGSRPARVRVSRRPPMPEAPAPQPASAAEPESAPPVEVPTAPIAEPQPVEAPIAATHAAEPAPPIEEPETAAEEPPSEQAQIEAAVAEVLGHLLAGLDVEPQMEWMQDERATLWVRLRGKDDESLVGPRGKTLDALQYLTRLLVRQRVGGEFNLVVDAGGYRKRRMRSLANLARQMAEKAVKTGRAVRLRPMPASERRIIHLTLQDDRRVRTHSVGSGTHRAVTISPARGSKRKR